MVEDRIEDLDEVRHLLAELVPEVSMVMAHGRMPARELEAAVGSFYERAHHLLLSTNIIESGLDIPTANTMIVHRSEMFGLAQLYQLRGRVGRSKTRAYALFTVPVGRQITPQAERRLRRSNPACAEHQAHSDFAWDQRRRRADPERPSGPGPMAAATSLVSAAGDPLRARTPSVAKGQPSSTACASGKYTIGSMRSRGDR